MFWQKTKKRKRGEPLPENHDGLPDSSRPQGLCPRCEKQSSFDYAGSLPLTFDGGYILARDGGPDMPTCNEQSSVLICRNCQQGVAVLEERYVGEYPSKKNKKGGGTITWRGFHWWPLAGASLHQSVPSIISEAFQEAVIALSAKCPRAAAVMARRTLEAVAADQGESTGSLAQRLNNLSNKGLLHDTLAEWAKEVRLIGNSGAHFDPINNVTEDDARQLINFIRELAKFIYILPHELNEHRSKKS